MPAIEKTGRYEKPGLDQDTPSPPPQPHDLCWDGRGRVNVQVPALGRFVIDMGVAARPVIRDRTSGVPEIDQGDRLILSGLLKLIEGYWYRYTSMRAYGIKPKGEGFALSGLTDSMKASLGPCHRFLKAYDWTTAPDTEPVEDDEEAIFGSFGHVVVALPTLGRFVVTTRPGRTPQVHQISMDQREDDPIDCLILASQLKVILTAWTKFAPTTASIDQADDTILSVLENAILTGGWLVDSRTPVGSRPPTRTSSAQPPDDVTRSDRGDAG